MLLKILVIWLVLAVLAVANGAARNAFLTPRLGEQRAHVASTAVLCLVILAVAWASIRWIGPESAAGALLVGAVWLLLTLAFEFLAGHYLFGHPWSRLVADYNLARGRVWVFVLVATLIAPWLAFWIRRP